jgi:hypothetical protein
LPAREYQVLVYNLNEPGGPAVSPKPGTFALYDPAEACFYDFFESGAGKWERGGDWDIAILPTGERAMTDSPAGNYDSAPLPAVTHTTYITSQAFSLADCPNPLLTFHHDYNILNFTAEWGSSQDIGQVEISADGGATWIELTNYSGGGPLGMKTPSAESSEWADVQWQDIAIRLQAALGSTYTGTVRLRFGLEVDQHYSAKGWVVDDVIVQSREIQAGPSVFLPVILRGE